jgi:hypothetical protein
MAMKHSGFKTEFMKGNPALDLKTQVEIEEKKRL